MSLQPHGGVLVNRLVDGSSLDEKRLYAKTLQSVTIRDRELSDLYLIAVGALSPLTGFMCKDDYNAVVEKMTLADGLPWSVPITMSTTSEQAEKLSLNSDIALVDANSNIVGILHLTEKYLPNKDLEAEKVYRTADKAHPGVQKVYEGGDVYLAGSVEYFAGSRLLEFPESNLTPAQTRAIFAERGWKTIVAFQTRNPIHRAHEYLLRCALEIVDGLLVHPLVGETKSDDIPADVRMQCYNVLLDKYFVKERVLLSVLPAAMRYAGPKEAIHHAIMRKNYGCTHFIVGRDHAGVGTYYGSFDAQLIFDEVDMSRLEITPLKFENSFWCNLINGMATVKTSPSTPDQRVSLSGTKVREMLAKGERPPVEFSRPEVADILIAAARKNNS